MGVMLETAETLQRVPVLDHDRHEVWVLYDDENVWMVAKRVTVGEQSITWLEVEYLLWGEEKSSKVILKIKKSGEPGNQKVVLKISKPIKELIDKQKPLVEIIAVKEL